LGRPNTSLALSDFLKKVASDIDDGRRYRGSADGTDSVPRLRRCTVEQVFQLVGGGGSDEEAEEDDEETGVARELLEAAEAGEQELVTRISGHDCSGGYCSVYDLIVMDICSGQEPAGEPGRQRQPQRPRRHAADGGRPGLRRQGGAGVQG
jgi:hypothetical protein